MAGDNYEFWILNSELRLPIASATSCISHLGVDVAPQMPTVAAPSNHAGSISEASSRRACAGWPGGTPRRGPCRSTTCARRRTPRRRTVRKLREVLFAVRYLPADRVVDVHLPRIGGPAAHFGAQPFEQPDALRGLRKEIDRTREVDQLQVLHPFDHDRRVRDLPRDGPPLRRGPVFRGSRPALRPGASVRWP